MVWYKWASVNDRVDGQVRKGLNSVIILGAWAIWTQHNRCVFNDISPFLTGVIYVPSFRGVEVLEFG
jgi:hypothetical protein